MDFARRTVLSRNMRSARKEVDRDPRVDHLVHLPVRTVQARALMYRFYKQGRCNNGDLCNFLDTGKPGPAATSGSGSRKSGVKGEARAVEGKISSKDSKTSKSSSQRSKGSGSRSNKNKRRVPAAVCLLGALIAASTSTPADAASFAFRKEVPDNVDPCYLANHLALPAVRFSDCPDYVNIPFERCLPRVLGTWEGRSPMFLRA